ncbi:hypothetical protein IEQ34_015400 [Dendrobium chrysotoxum]|uniref:Uncharacterized protein n=1 Tax=Dendrobium chrysotoxum TaxID=161865 RepID=A0AAV7GI38_DENCH|nr:hypothetical protein IEQ34_015400 [Dendrobium chrysotoxum]
MVAEAEGEGDEAGEEDEVRGDGVSIHKREKRESSIKKVGAGEGGQKGGVCVTVGGNRATHLVEKACGEGEVTGTGSVAEDDVVCDSGRGVVGGVEHPVEEGERAAVVRLAGEEGDHEARGKGRVVGGRRVRREIGGHDGVELGGGGGGGEGGEEGIHVHAAVEVLVVTMAGILVSSRVDSGWATIEIGVEPDVSAGGGGVDGRKSGCLPVRGGASAGEEGEEDSLGVRGMENGRNGERKSPHRIYSTTRIASPD